MTENLKQKNRNYEEKTWTLDQICSLPFLSIHPWVSVAV